MAPREQGQRLRKARVVKLPPMREQADCNRYSEASPEVAHRVDQRRCAVALAGRDPGIGDGRYRHEEKGQSESLKHPPQGRVPKVNVSVEAPEEDAREA